LVTKSTIL